MTKYLTIRELRPAMQTVLPRTVAQELGARRAPLKLLREESPIFIETLSEHMETKAAKALTAAQREDVAAS